MLPAEATEVQYADVKNTFHHGELSYWRFETLMPLCTHILATTGIGPVFAGAVLDLQALCLRQSWRRWMVCKETGSLQVLLYCLDLYSCTVVGAQISHGPRVQRSAHCKCNFHVIVC